MAGDLISAHLCAISQIQIGYKLKKLKWLPEIKTNVLSKIEKTILKVKFFQALSELLKFVVGINIDIVVGVDISLWEQ